MVYLVEHNVIDGDVALEALGAAEERREALHAAGEGDGFVASDRSRRDVCGITKLQASQFINLGRDLLMMMKLLVASMLILCVLLAISIMKK